jgi:hypothetical protein
MASEATPFFEWLWRAKRRRSSNGYGERSDAVLRTAMASEATPFFERLCAGMTKVFDFNSML